MVDPRRAASVIYPLPALLTMAVVAILANHESVLAMADWGARQAPDLHVALGFPQDRAPCQSTLQRLFRQLDGDALAALLRTAFAPSSASLIVPTNATVLSRRRIKFQRASAPA